MGQRCARGEFGARCLAACRVVGSAVCVVERAPSIGSIAEANTKPPGGLRLGLAFWVWEVAVYMSGASRRSASPCELRGGREEVGLLLVTWQGTQGYARARARARAESEMIARCPTQQTRQIRHGAPAARKTLQMGASAGLAGRGGERGRARALCKQAGRARRSKGRRTYVCGTNIRRPCRSVRCRSSCRPPAA